MGLFQREKLYNLVDVMYYPPYIYYGAKNERYY